MTSKEVYESWKRHGGEHDEWGGYIMPIQFINECLPHANGSLENLEAMIESGMAEEIMSEQ